MDDATRQPMAGGANRPQLSFPLYLAAALAALVWPRLAPDAGLFARLGPDATGILWVPFALWAAAEGVLLLAPHVGALSAGDARRLAIARLVSGIRLLARCAVWLIPLVMLLGADPRAWGTRVFGLVSGVVSLVTGIALVAVLLVMVSGILLLAATHEMDGRPATAPTDLVSDRAGAGPVSGILGRLASAVRGWLVRLLRTLLRRSARTSGSLAAEAARGARAALAVGLHVAVRWTIDGAATLGPRLGSDPLRTVEAAADSVATRRAANAAAGASAALAVSGSLLGRVVAFLRGARAGDPDQPVIYGPARRWFETQTISVPSSSQGRPATKTQTIEHFQRLQRHPYPWRNDPAVGELCEVGNALLIAASTDFIAHGNSQRVQSRDPLDGQDGESVFGFGAASPAVAPGEAEKRVIITRAWARPDYFAYIFTTSSPVSGDMLRTRLTAENLAYNFAQASHFPPAQVMAWLHIHDQRLVDDPARAGQVGIFIAFDRGEARTARVSAPPTETGRDEDDPDNPFPNAPW